MKTNEFDPIAYIEDAFLDNRIKRADVEETELEISIPSLADYLGGHSSNPLVDVLPEAEVQEDSARFRKTVMSAPRPRRSKRKVTKSVMDPDLHETWTALPKNVAFLCSFFDDSVTKNYYRGEFKESRQELIRRLLDPELSLEETARLLGVCPATVRRYTNRSWLSHHRTIGGQRRFRLSNIVKFVDEHGRLPEE